VPLRRDCGEHAWAVLTRGFVTFVSPEDAHHLQGRRWHAARINKRVTYAQGTQTQSRKHQYLHRVILGDALGTDANYTDHANHDGTDNRRSNLRVATNQQNIANNRQGPGRSRYRGVTFDARRGCWYARIGRGHQYLGTFLTAEAAACAFDAAAIKRFGEFATLNFPEGAS
jgi:HNH endonuclease